MLINADESVHPSVRRAAAWSWRILVLIVALLVVLFVLYQLEVIVIPVAVALLFSALLIPSVDWLVQHKIPRGLAVFFVIITAIAVLATILVFAIEAFVDGVPELADQVTVIINSSEQWLINGPLHLQHDQISTLGDTAITTLRNNQARLTSGALSTAKTLTEIITGLCVTVFTLIFFLYDGRNIWGFLVRFFPTHVRSKVDRAGVAGFQTLTGYVRATCLVAFVDALGVGIGLAILGIPLALPLASFVFLGAFIPLIGAVTTGLLAVVIALIAHGWISALIVLGIILMVEQLESHVLQPLVMGRAVSIHPLAVVLGIAIGAVLAGIGGALLAVPTIAFVDRAIRVLISKDDTMSSLLLPMNFPPEG